MNATFKKDKLPLKTGFICMIDVLGYKNIEFEKVRNLWNKISDTLEKTVKRLEQSGVILEKVFLSDTIILFFSLNIDTYPDILIEEVDNEILVNFLSIIFLISSSILGIGLEQSILLRGAFSYGDFVFDDNLNLFHGKGMLEAHQWYESTDWSGIILTPSLEFFLDSKLETKDTIISNFISLYPGIPMKAGYEKSVKYALKWLDLKINDSSYPIFPLKKFLHSASKLKMTPEVMNKIRHTQLFISFLNEENSIES